MIVSRRSLTLETGPRNTLPRSEKTGPALARDRLTLVGSADRPSSILGPMLTQDEQDAERAAPMRSVRDVTIVAHDLGAVGGMEHALAELVLGLRDLGDRVTVIARTCELPPEAAVEFHRVRGPSRPLIFAYPWFMLAGSLAVRKWRKGVTQATGAIVLNRLDVIAVHYCQQVGRATPSRSTWPFRAHARLVGYLTRVGERLCFAANRPAAIVGVSEGVAAEVRLHYPQLADRVISIPNGVDTAVFAPERRVEEVRRLRERLAIADDRLVAAFVGSEWERKGLEAAIRALALTSGWDLVVAGSGDRQRYQELADSLGVGGALHWLGVSRDMQLVYGLADALVFPTSYEAFSLVTLEAAACGVPILATPVNGVSELLSDGQSGYLISQEPRTIAERLQLLGADPALRAKMGRATRQAALGFTWKTMVARHHELYLRLADTPPSDAPELAAPPASADGRE
jgi:glycosyltransferase involved in cell wall biosynthesis